MNNYLKINWTVLNILWLFMLPVLSFAASHAIVPGNQYNGDGTSWLPASAHGKAGAYNAIPTVLVRGDTYYFAKGKLVMNYTYGYPCDDATIGIQKIFLKKAISTEHGIDNGWVDTLDDGSTFFESTTPTSYYNAIFSFASSYYEFDGVNGIENNISSYGFVFQYAVSTPTNGLTYLCWNPTSSNPTNIKLAHIAFITQGSTVNKGQFCIEGLGKNITVSNCYFKNGSVFIHSCGDSLIVENSYFQDNWSSSQNHGASINTAGNFCVIRNNIFNNAINGTGGLEVIKQHVDGDVDGWKIYNNVFFGGNAGNGCFAGQTGSEWAGMINWKVYNNTFVDVQARFYSPDWGNGNEIKNNLYYKSNQDISLAKGCFFSNNYYNSCTNVPALSMEPGQRISFEIPSLLFVDAEKNDFHVASDTSKIVGMGIVLDSLFKRDKDNFSRDQNENNGWDAGAYTCRIIHVSIDSSKSRSAKPHGICISNPH